MTCLCEASHHQNTQLDYRPESAGAMHFQCLLMKFFVFLLVQMRFVKNLLQTTRYAVELRFHVAQVGVDISNGAGSLC